MLHPATVVDTDTPSKRDPGFWAGVFTLGQEAWRAFWAPPDPLKMYPEEARQVRLYWERGQRLRTPPMFLGEASEARKMFLLKKFSGKRELFYVDTETKEVTPLAFLAFWKGEPEHYDLEIGSITDHDRHTRQRGISGVGRNEEEGHPQSPSKSAQAPSYNLV